MTCGKLFIWIFFFFLTFANFQIPIFCILALIETLFLRTGVKDEIEMKEEL